MTADYILVGYFAMLATAAAVLTVKDRKTSHDVATLKKRERTAMETAKMNYELYCTEKQRSDGLAEQLATQRQEYERQLANKQKRIDVLTEFDAAKKNNDRSTVA